MKKKFAHYHYCYWTLGNRLTFRCSLLMTSIINHTRETNTHWKRQLHTWLLCSSCWSFFTFWGAEKQLFHISPFRSTSYVLKSFGCLEVCNRVSKWIEGKNLIFVGQILQICQLEIPVFINKLMCESSLWVSVSYGFCEFNRVASCNKGKAIILVRSSFQICQLEILVSYST